MSVTGVGEHVVRAALARDAAARALHGGRGGIEAACSAAITAGILQA